MKLLQISLLWLLSALAVANPLHVGYDSVFAPFTYQDEQGQARGLHVEIIEGMLQHAGVEYRFVGYPWKRLVAMSDHGAVDIALPFRHKEERFERYNMIGPLTATGSRTFLYTAVGRNIQWETLDDLAGRRVGMLEDFAYPDKLEKETQIEFVRFNTSTRNLARMMLAKRDDIELLVSDETVFWDAVSDLDLTDFVEAGNPLDSVYRYAVVPKEKKELAERVRAMLEAFKKTEAYNRILSKYNLIRQ